MSAADDTRPPVIYGIDDRPPLREAVPLGFQHVVAMLLGNITPPLLITGALGLAIGERALSLQLVLLMAGLATVVQAYPIGPIGGRIPIIMGTSIAFVGGAIGIELRPEVLQNFPSQFQTFFGSGLITGGLTGLLLNLALPEGPAQEPSGMV